MDYQLICQPTFSALEVDLGPGERIVGDAGAMAWMSPNIKTTTTTRGGVLQGLKRAVLSGESFFQNTSLRIEGFQSCSLVCRATCWRSVPGY